MHPKNVGMLHPELLFNRKIEVAGWGRPSILGGSLSPLATGD